MAGEDRIPAAMAPLAAELAQAVLQSVGEARQAQALGDARQFSLRVHQIKGMAMTFGLAGMASLAARLEKMAPGGEAARAALDELEARAAALAVSDSE